ncbi:MAG: ABC transporter ATP-binding protein, partial [Corynebacterium urealyticum]
MTTATSHSTQALQQKRNARSASGLTMDAITLEVTDGAATRRVLNEVSLHIAPGELVGITGPS